MKNILFERYSVRSIGKNNQVSEQRASVLKTKTPLRGISSTYNGNFNQKPRHIKYHNILWH